MLIFYDADLYEKSKTRIDQFLKIIKSAKYDFNDISKKEIKEISMELKDVWLYIV